MIYRIKSDRNALSLSSLIKVAAREVIMDEKLLVDSSRASTELKLPAHISSAAFVLVMIASQSILSVRRTTIVKFSFSLLPLNKTHLFVIAGVEEFIEFD